MSLLGRLRGVIYGIVLEQLNSKLTFFFYQLIKYKKVNKVFKTFSSSSIKSQSSPRKNHNSFTIQFTLRSIWDLLTLLKVKTFY